MKNDHQRKVNDCIHIRPALWDVDEASEVCDQNPDFVTHIVMMGMRNFMVVMHDPDHKCFICMQSLKPVAKEKYIY